MRSICNIDLKNNVAWGSSSIAYSTNEILLSIYPSDAMKTNFRIETTDIGGKVTVSSVKQEINGLIEYVMPLSSYIKAGSFKVRLLSDEDNSSYIQFKTLEALTDGDDIICKYRFATQTFEVYKIVIEKGGSDYDDTPIWNAIDEIRAKYITVDVFNAEKATIYSLIAEKASISDLTAINADIANLKANKADIGELNAEVAKIEELIAKKASIDDLHALEATIEQLNVHIANIDKAIIDVAHISDLEVLEAKINDIEAGQIDTDYLDAHYAKIDLANIKDGCIATAMIGEGVIQSAQIADGSITDAKIVTLTANKLTAGRIDASDIEVVNLNCANLTVGTINGKQITNGAIDWDKLASQVGDTITTADENASQALDDALKAFEEAQKANSAAGTAQSTANGKNTVIYANAQPSTSGRKTNDVWFDTDDSYKMYYFNGTSWVAAQFGTNAIKNASITTALIADAAINNAKISNLDAGKITTGYLSADRIAANSIIAGKLAVNAVTTANLQADCVNADKIAAKSINAEHINGAIITGDKIVASSITGDKIAAKTIDATKLVANTITAAQIKAGTITATEIDVGSIKAVILTANSITATQIAANSITAEKIKADAVTAAKIATDAIKSRNYIDNSVGSFLNLADGSFKSKNLKWNANGDLTASNANITGAINATSGTFKGTISASTITGSTISGGTIKGASISGNTISGNTISGNTISGGTISGASISGGSITSNTTINVSTNLTIGNSIYIGSYSDRNTQKYIYFNDRFIVTSRNDILAIGLNNGDPFKGKVYVSTSGGITVRGTNAVNLVSDAYVYSKASGSIDMESTGYLQLRSTGGGLKLQTGSMIIYFENSGIGISSNNFRPAEACIGSIAFGTSKYLYYRFYAREGIYQPSDIRMKTNIKEYDERFENMYMDLKPITYQWKNDIGRSHCGLIAQWTKNAMDKHGIDEREFGAYEHDRKEDTYGITYTELPSLNMHMIQKTIKRVDTQEYEIARLKDKVAELQSKLNAYILGEMEVRKA